MEIELKPTSKALPKGFEFPSAFSSGQNSIFNSSKTSKDLINTQKAKNANDLNSKEEVNEFLQKCAKVY